MIPRRAVAVAGFVVAGVVVALGFTALARWLGAPIIFLYFIAAIAVIAWAVGAAAGTATVVVSTLVTAFALTHWNRHLPPTVVGDAARLASFALVGTIIAQLTGALRRARARADESSRAKDRFLAAMSHELRTPLNAVVAYTALLEEGVAGPASASQRDMLARIHSAATHLTELVNNVLDIARSQHGRLAVKRERFDVRGAVDEALDLVRPMAEQKGVRLSTAGRPDLACLGDGARFRQIIANLVTNAVKFTPAGGSVEVSWGHEPTRADTGWICVTDTGRGIAERDQERVFAAFEQAEDSAVGGVSLGMGLGLAISRRLARAMGGDISVESELGAGSSFTVSLPAPSHAGGGSSGGDNESISYL